MNKKQLGITLIELMISLTLSLTLVAGIGSLFVQMQKSNKVQSAVTNMMDDSRYIQEILQKEIRRTGGLRSPEATAGKSDQVFLALNAPFAGSALNFGNPVAVGVPPVTQGEYIEGVKVAGNDQMILRYQLVDNLDLSAADPTNSSSPCTQALVLGPGQDPAVTVHLVTLYFYLKNNSLMCQSRRDWIDPAAPGVLTLVPGMQQAETSLIDNVQQMAVTYGVDSDDIPDSAADYYTDADTLNLTPTSWVNVVSLRLTLVLKSADNNVVTKVTSYDVDGTSVTPGTGDKRLYRVFSTTIALRNQI